MANCDEVSSNGFGCSHDDDLIFPSATGGKSIDGGHTLVPFPKKMGQKGYSPQDILNCSHAPH